MPVEQLHWPVDEARRAELRASSVPRLLLVERDTPPPVASDWLEDWIRVPADDADLRARVAALELRASSASEREPTLDDDGILRFRSRWVSLSPLEVRLASVFLERFGAVVSRDAMQRAGWPALPPGSNALDAHLVRMRRRVAPIELAIRNVRSRGFLLEPSDRQVAERALPRRLA